MALSTRCTCHQSWNERGLPGWASQRSRWESTTCGKRNPARYGSLTDPGDQYSYDIYTQAARALLAGSPRTPWPHCTPSGCWQWVSPSRRST